MNLYAPHGVNKLLVQFFICLALLSSCSHREALRRHAAPQKTEVLCCDSSSCTPSKALLELLALVRLKHDSSLPSIVRATQQSWLRPKGQERWQIAATYQEMAPEIMPLLGRMGLLEDRQPRDRRYRYALVLGATYQTMRERMKFLIQVWKRGVVFDEIVLLGSQRPVDLSMDSLDDVSVQPTSMPRTETDLLKLLWATLPQGLRKLPHTVVDTPMKPQPDGSMARPTTGDTINYWLKVKPKVGSVLAISNQPYVQYQQAVLKTLLPGEFQVETVGSASGTDQIGLHLDNVARILYQEHERIEGGRARGGSYPNDTISQQSKRVPGA